MGVAQQPVDPAKLLAHIAEAPEVKERAALAGLQRVPFDDGDMKQECANCIYYLPNYKHCDQPELDFPVDPDWWCLLWRV